MNEDFLDEKVDYLSDVEEIIELEDSLDKLPEGERGALDHYNEKHGTDHDTKWSNRDVSIHASRLYQLEKNGIIDRVFDSNSKTLYSMSDHIDEVKDMVEAVNNKYEGNTEIALHDFPDEDDLDGVFDDVIGYDDVKWLMKRALTSEDIVNIALVGPPGSAKTVFLMCISEMDGSEFISGKPTSGPGFLDLMFDEKPRYMCIDEVDDMEATHQKNLSDYMEHGLITETKGNKTRKLKTNASTFVAANSLDPIIDQIEDRLTDIHFEPYTKEEYIEVVEHILQNKQGKDKEEAKLIAEAVWDREQSGNVRLAIQVGRLSKGDPKKVISVLDNYSGSSPGSSDVLF